MKKEQPLPTANQEQCIQDLVIEDIKESKKIGLERYGTVLQPGNGRNSARDLYEELIDACQYCKQLDIERTNMVCMLNYIYSLSAPENDPWFWDLKDLLTSLGELK